MLNIQALLLCQADSHYCLNFRAKSHVVVQPPSQLTKLGAYVCVYPEAVMMHSLSLWATLRPVQSIYGLGLNAIA